MNDAKGKVVGINGNMLSVEFTGNVAMNEVGYVKVDNKKLKGEIIRIRGNTAQMQIYEMTNGIKASDEVEFTGEMLAVRLGPGLLGQVYDGLQNPLPLLAEKAGYFLERGVYVEPLPTQPKWKFTPTAKVGDVLYRGDCFGTVPEGPFTHKILVPFDMYGVYKVKSIVSEGDYTIEEKIAVVTDEKGNDKELSMSFEWPVKRADRKSTRLNSSH